jgi:hypothetical protein
MSFGTWGEVHGRARLGPSRGSARLRRSFALPSSRIATAQAELRPTEPPALPTLQPYRIAERPFLSLSEFEDDRNA